MRDGATQRIARDWERGWRGATSRIEFPTDDMARIRSIKPAFFVNEQLATLPYEWRLLFIGLWTQADRAGRLEDRPLRLKASIFPHDTLDIDAGLASLDAAGLITRYVVDGAHLIAIPTWDKHQQPHIKEPHSLLPPPGAGTLSALGSHRAGPSGTGTDQDPDQDQDPDPDPDQGADPVHTRATRADAHDPPDTSTVRGRFLVFWERYPRRVAYGAASRAWERLKPDAALLDQMLRALEAQRQSPQWQRENGQFIPNPDKWLNEKRWLDEGPDVGPATTSMSATTRANLVARDAALVRLRSAR